jgi:hypothetical protein
VQSPIRLTDDEMDALYAAARPIAPDRRDEFLQAVAAALTAEREVGPGIVYRTICRLQRDFFDPPDLANPVIRHNGVNVR